ncbi:MAG: hypothetical protein ACM3ZA_00445 [Bacillota bacterium]
MSWWKGRLWAAVGASVITVAGVATGYALTSARLRQPARPEPRFEEARAAGQAAAEGVTVPVIGPSTVLVVRTTYLKCDRTVEEALASTPDTVGLSLEAVRRFHPEWTVIDFTPERVVVREVKDAWCPGMDPAEMERYRTIGVRDDKVTVFWGKPQPDQPVKEVTTFPTDILQPQDRRLLERGYVVEGDEAVAQYLEGLAE